MDLNNLNIIAFWKDHLKIISHSNGQLNATCFECGKEKHWYANEMTGCWDCKKCGKSGNIITYLRDYKGLSSFSIKKVLEKYHVNQNRLVIRRKIKSRFSKEFIKRCVSNLTPGNLSILSRERGINEDTLKNADIGITNSGEYIVPVYAQNGQIVNILRKRLGGDTINSKGGESRVYGIKNIIANSIIYGVEGCWSALALTAHSLPSVGFIGAGVLREEDIKLFKNKKVILIPDLDERGLEGMKKIARKLQGVASEIEVIHLPKELGAKRDVRDFFKAGCTRKDLLSLPREKIAVNYENDSKEFNPNMTALNIIKNIQVIFAGDEFFEYKDGYYQKRHDKEVDKWIKNELKNLFNLRRTHEVKHVLKTDCFTRNEKLNQDKSRLNLINGLLDLKTYILEPHSSDFLSTIRIPIGFDPLAECLLWKKTLLEIFMGDEEKISILQEFLGYCLKPDNSHQYALLNVGEGANGKSVIFSVFQHIVGVENCSSIPLECFSNRHYLADLHCKLVNVSIEAEAKGSIHDANFKAVVSGDSITVDRKYGHPFEFKPFSKLVFAMNDLPRIDDKSYAFFRRLIILRYQRIFSEKEQNKNLKYELLVEMPGILNWMLTGLKRLEQRGHFTLNKSMKEEINRYRKENNNVLLFVEEECELYQKRIVKRPEWQTLEKKLEVFESSKYKVEKQKLFEAYTSFCKASGCFPLSKINFGKQLQKQFPLIDEYRGPESRFWTKIRLLKSPPIS